MTRNEKKIERMNTAAMESGLSYGFYVAKKEKPIVKKTEKPIEQKTEKKVEVKPVAKPRTKIKNGWTLEMVESWREVRRMFGRE